MNSLPAMTRQPAGSDGSRHWRSRLLDLGGLVPARQAPPPRRLRPRRHRAAPRPLRSSAGRSRRAPCPGRANEPGHVARTGRAPSTSSRPGPRPSAVTTPEPLVARVRLDGSRRPGIARRTRATTSSPGRRRRRSRSRSRGRAPAAPPARRPCPCATTSPAHEDGDAVADLLHLVRAGGSRAGPRRPGRGRARGRAPGPRRRRPGRSTVVGSSRMTTDGVLDERVGEAEPLAHAARVGLDRSVAGLASPTRSSTLVDAPLGLAPRRCR